MFPKKYNRAYFNETMFFGKGKCSKYSNVTHSYGLLQKNEWPGIEYDYIDLYDFSCLNGWGFGNIAATASNGAKFFYELLGTNNFINDTTKETMMNWEEWKIM